MRNFEGKFMPIGVLLKQSAIASLTSSCQLSFFFNSANIDGATLIDSFAVKDSERSVLNPYSFILGFPLGLLMLKKLTRILSLQAG